MAETSGCELIAFVAGTIVPYPTFDVRFRRNLTGGRSRGEASAVES